MIRLIFLYSILLIILTNASAFANGGNFSIKNQDREILDIQVSNANLFTGERIWYSISVTNEQGQSGVSSIAYVELLNDSTKLIAKQMIRLYSGKGEGSIELPHQLRRGHYQLHAYTSWMKTASPALVCKKNVLIESCYTSPSEYFSFVQRTTYPNISIAFTAENNLNIESTSTEAATFRLMVEGRVIEERNLLSGRNNFVVNLTDEETPREFFIGLFSRSGELLEARRVSKNEKYSFSVKANKSFYRPKDRVELDLKLTDQNLSFLSADLTISLREITTDRDELTSYDACSWPYFEIQKDMPNPKEVLVYPVSDFRKNFRMKKIELQKDSEKDRDLPTNLTTLLKEVYDTALHDTESTVFKPLADRIYAPVEFALMSSLEDFFTEVVPEVRVKKKKGVRIIQLRNNENPSNIYFYKDLPLILIDGFIQNDVNAVLDLSPSEIASIEIGFKLNTINNFGINQLADNGFISLYTNKHSRFKASSDIQPFEGFYTGPTFLDDSNIKKGETGDETPDFRSPVYWNPFFKMSGRGKISFQLSNDFADFILQIKGRTSKGEAIHFSTKLVVRPPK